MPLVLKIALVAVVVVGATAALLRWTTTVLQHQLMYYPATEHVLPSAENLNNVEERVLTTPDGERVLVWYGRAKPGMPTLLYFHGNAGSLADRAERIRKYMAKGYGMFMMTYRGFGGSTGLAVGARERCRRQSRLRRTGRERRQSVRYHHLWRVSWLERGRAGGSQATVPRGSFWMRRTRRWSI